MTDSKKIKVWKLRTQDESSLGEGLKKLKEELQQLRVAKVAGGTAAKLGKIKFVRKAIAKYLTLLNEKARDKLREKYAKGKLPKDLRAKKTRALRRALTKTQRRQRTEGAWKKAKNFPLRKFSLKVAAPKK